MDAIATVTTLSKNSKLAGVYGITIDEKDNLYVITTAYDGAGVPNNPLIDPAIYKIDSKTRDNIIFVVSLANDTRGHSYDDQGICYFNQSLYVPRMGQITKIDLRNGKAPIALLKMVNPQRHNIMSGMKEKISSLEAINAQLTSRLKDRDKYSQIKDILE